MFTCSYIDKQVAKSFSINCLRPALALLAQPGSPNVLETVEKCISAAIFSTENLVDYIHALEARNLQKAGDAGFSSLLKNLYATNRDSFDGKFFSSLLTLDISGLPLLLKLGLSALATASPKLDAE